MVEIGAEEAPRPLALDITHISSCSLQIPCFFVLVLSHGGTRTRGLPWRFEYEYGVEYEYRFTEYE